MFGESSVEDRPEITNKLYKYICLRTMAFNCFRTKHSFGTMKCHSKEHKNNILGTHLIESLTQSLDNNIVGCGISIDLQKAFDMKMSNDDIITDIIIT